MVSGAIQVKCAIAIDSNNESMEEIIRKLLPGEWLPRVTISRYAQWTDVIEMVRSTQPALLVIHSNLLLLSPEGGIESCVAVSPNTRYLLLTAWSEEIIGPLLKGYAPLPVSVLRMPFDRTQLIAALEDACGALP